MSTSYYRHQNCFLLILSYASMDQRDYILYHCGITRQCEGNITRKTKLFLCQLEQLSEDIVFQILQGKRKAPLINAIHNKVTLFLFFWQFCFINFLSTLNSPWDSLPLLYGLFLPLPSHLDDFLGTNNHHSFNQSPLIVTIQYQIGWCLERVRIIKRSWYLFIMRDPH